MEQVEREYERAGRLIWSYSAKQYPLRAYEWGFSSIESAAKSVFIWQTGVIETFAGRNMTGSAASLKTNI